MTMLSMFLTGRKGVIPKRAISKINRREWMVRYCNANIAFRRVTIGSDISYIIIVQRSREETGHVGMGNCIGVMINKSFVVYFLKEMMI